MNRLQSKRALVTGGGQGLGRAIVEELLSQGCDVAIHYHKSSEGAEAVKQAAPPGVRAQCFAADLTSATPAHELVDRAVCFLGGLDILVNNTGDLVGRRKIEDLDLQFWQGVIEVNLASLAGRMGGHAGSLAYSAAKGAVLTWTRSLARDLGPRGIRVNAVAPGLILGTSFHNTHTTAESAAATVTGIPLGRAGTPADVARAVAFLASEGDGFITGATLDINGGVFGC